MFVISIFFFEIEFFLVLHFGEGNNIKTKQQEIHCAYYLVNLSQRDFYN